MTRREANQARPEYSRQVPAQFRFLKAAKALA